MFRKPFSFLLSLSRRVLFSPLTQPHIPFVPLANSFSSSSFSSLRQVGFHNPSRWRPLSPLSPLSSFPRVFLSDDALPTTGKVEAEKVSEEILEGEGEEEDYYDEEFFDDIPEGEGREEEDEEYLDSLHPIEKVTKTAKSRQELLQQIKKQSEVHHDLGDKATLFPDLSQSLSSAQSEVDIRDILAQVEGLPQDPLGFAEIAKFLDSNATFDPTDTAKFDEMKQTLKQPIERKFRDFIETMHQSFNGDEKALTLFAATAVHAQLFGPTLKNDMSSVTKILPFLKTLLFSSDSSSSSSSSSSSVEGGKTDFEKALDETTEKERAILSSILDKVKPERARIHSLKLSDLKYMKLYPKIVRQWIVDAKTPYGYYGEDGFWVPVEITPETVSEMKEKQLEAARRYATLRADDDILDNAIPVYPPDLEGHFRFNLQRDEIEKMNFEPKTLQVLSFAHANQREINRFRIKKAIEKWGRFPGDTGSDEVQAAVMTEKMFYLSVHFKNNPNDKARKRMFLMLLARRQRLLNKLKRERTEVYYALLRDLQIPDTARSYTTGFLPGLSIPKQGNLSRQKRQRLLKGKVISQRAHELAARRPKAKA